MTSDWQHARFTLSLKRKCTCAATATSNGLRGPLGFKMDSLPNARRREIRSRAKKRRNQKRRRESEKALNIGFISTPNGEDKEVVQEKEISDEWVFETSYKSHHQKDDGAVSTASTSKDAPSAVSSPPFLLPQPSHTCVPAHSGVSEQHTAYSAQTRTALWGMSVPKIVGNKNFLPYEQSFTSAQLVEDIKDVEEAWTTEEDDPASSL
ncbi:hypothetical protein CC78DRAFT_585121 [Lojkania enalia]|uniref:Uncharacterized protein n=1 Tax=Lojkania enalia TaxID=147567 RepID=A0A9P4K0A0_9PLEO|nr:hypothetical protein CC78DRAFT_585121 [Didymosphaeria enalia]